jgi:hypothetical protein
MPVSRESGRQLRYVFVLLVFVVIVSFGEVGGGMSRLEVVTAMSWAWRWTVGIGVEHGRLGALFLIPLPGPQKC